MMIISHRGNDNHNYKENTIEAVVFSLNRDYVDGVEVDIMFTKDKEIVLNHDYIYNNLEVNNTNYNELKLDRLDDLLKRLDTIKLILIEVKSEKKDKEFITYLEMILKKYSHLNIALCSFNYRLIKYIHKNYNYKCGLLIGTNKNKFRFRNNLDFNSVKYTYLNKYKYIDYIWTINDIEIYKNIKLLNKEINIITDIPYKLKCL